MSIIFQVCLSKKQGFLRVNIEKETIPLTKQVDLLSLLGEFFKWYLFFNFCLFAVNFFKYLRVKLRLAVVGVKTVNFLFNVI